MNDEGFGFRIVDPDEVEGPINVCVETWDDEKMHYLGPECWCNPRIDGKYVHHRSVFDAIEEDCA